MSEKTTDFEGWAASHRGHFERRAKLVFKAVKLRVKEPALIKLYDAMEYALLGGGKRVRALLVYAAGDVTEAPQEVLTDIALAIEAIHAYSLVHDDLPCMDNDTLRRGKPTCHVAFGEAQALLAGDALQPFAFSILANLGIADERTVNLTQKHIRGRLAEALLVLKETYGYEADGCTLKICLPREDLANLSNMTTANAIRTLSNFATEGIVGLNGKKIKIIDKEKLEQINNQG